MHESSHEQPRVSSRLVSTRRTAWLVGIAGLAAVVFALGPAAPPKSGLPLALESAYADTAARPARAPARTHNFTHLSRTRALRRRGTCDMIGASHGAQGLA